MKTGIITLILLLACAACRSQIFENRTPDNAYITKIEFARFPDVTLNRAGVIFFYTDTSLVNTFIRGTAQEIIDSIKTNAFKLKFCDNDFRYKEYAVINTSMKHSASEIFTRITSVYKFVVTADKYRSVWNLRTFRRDLRFISRDTVYTGEFQSIASPQKGAASSTSFTLSISTFDFSLSSGIKNVNPIRIHSMPGSSQSVNVELRDRLLEQVAIQDKMQTGEVHIKPYKTAAIIFYLPVTN